MRNPTLTDKQAQVRDEVARYWRQHGKSPTVRELAAACGVSSSCTMQRHLEALVRKGALKHAGTYRYRGYQVVGENAPLTYAELQAENEGLRARVRELEAQRG